ncbi:ATP-binding protein [Psychromonas aquimarina]|uniref:ATP-binding protein n=1 Tax=Psychromonas aquimarina TaxID=444919 RepID=UPI00040AA546|nr:ATP-binding protein [Psychromonas aquimarina]
MKKLFILTYLFIVVTFFFTVIVMDQSELFSSDHWDEQSLKQDISATSYLLNEIALSHDQDYAEQALQNYMQLMQFKLTVYKDTDPALSSELKEKVISEKLAVEDVDDLLAYFTFGNEKHIYKVELDLQSPFWQEDSRLELLTLLEICAALALITFIVLFALSRRLRHLEKVCIAFADGDLDARASTRFVRRVGNLNSTLNFMAERIGQLIRSNRNLTNAVAHEFRTPIFRIQCNLDMLDDSSVRPEQMPYLEGMQGDLNELCSMVEELLHFAKMERLDTHLTLQETDIHSLLDAQLHHLQFETDKKLILETAGQCIVPIAVRAFQRAVSNIIRNGYKYAQSEVRIAVHKSLSEVHISIENDGPVIPLEDREAIFEPFIRLEKSRDRQSGGHGLGLAIVKQIIKQHKGRVYISDGRSGPCFNIILPLQA